MKGKKYGEKNINALFTIYPRSLVHFYIVGILLKLDKTYWTYRMYHVSPLVRFCRRGRECQDSPRGSKEDYTTGHISAFIQDRNVNTVCPKSRVHLYIV